MTSQPTLTDHEALLAALKAEGKQKHLVPIGQLIEIADAHGLFPSDLESNAVYLAKADWARKAARDYEPDSIPDLFSVTTEEKLDDGTKTVVRGYKSKDALTKTEWDQVIDEYTGKANRKIALCNKLVRERNRIGLKKRWAQLPLPFPEYDP